MTYIVMECHLSYAVVLDEEGRFLKAANRNYTVGQTVTDIIEMQLPQSEAQRKKPGRWLYSVAAAAACLMLVAISAFRMNAMPYACVYMTINPEIRVDVNRADKVLMVEGINPDGEALVEDYSFKRKELELVMDELVDRAIDMGYLHRGGTVTLTLDAENDRWVTEHSQSLGNSLNAHLKEKLPVTVAVTDRTQQVILPTDPNGSDYGESDYDVPAPAKTPLLPTPADSPYGESDYGLSDHDDTDYEAEADFDEDGSGYEAEDSDHDDGSDYEAEDSDNDDGSDYDSGDSDHDDDSDYEAEDSDDDDGSDYEAEDSGDDDDSDYEADSGYDSDDDDDDDDEGDSDYESEDED